MKLEGAEARAIEVRRRSHEGVPVVTDPYEDDDDTPTLQRPSPPSGPAPRETGIPPKRASGFRAAYAWPSAELQDLASSVFPEEDDTAVDRAPLAAPPADADSDADDDATTATELLEETATCLPEEDVLEAADDVAIVDDGDDDDDVVENTVTLPAELIAVLARASCTTDRPPAPVSEASPSSRPQSSSRPNSSKRDET